MSIPASALVSFCHLSCRFDFNRILGIYKHVFGCASFGTVSTIVEHMHSKMISRTQLVVFGGLGWPFGNMYGMLLRYSCMLLACNRQDFNLVAVTCHRKLRLGWLS